MFRPKVTIDRELYERIKRHAAGAGYSSWEEFVRHALEKEVDRLEAAEDEEEIKKRLKGLGYIS